MFHFSKTIFNLLTQAGWSPSRECEHFQYYRQLLTAHHFQLSEVQAKFLKNFGGLLIKHPHAVKFDLIDNFHFEVEQALQGGDPDWVKEDYSERVGESLCVIGEAFRRGMVLCMSPTGKVYAGTDDWLVYVGASGEEAIEALGAGRKLIPVPEYQPLVVPTAPLPRVAILPSPVTVALPFSQ